MLEESTQQAASESTVATAATTASADTSATQTSQTTQADTPEAKAKAEADAKAASETPEAKAKAEADAKAATEAKAKEDAAKAVPEKYDLKAPEGLVADPEVSAEFEGIAKELKLSQTDAQRLYDLAAKNATKNAAAVAAAQASWLEASKADKEFGGDKMEANLAIAKKAVALSPEIKTLLNETKLGDHPEMIRWMFRVGKALSEDHFVAGGKQTGGGGDTALTYDKSDHK